MAHDPVLIQQEGFGNAVKPPVDGRTALFPDEAAFFNVNTPEDLDTAKDMA